MEFVCIELAVENIIEQSDNEAGLELKGAAPIVSSPRTPEYVQERQPDWRGDKHKEDLNTNSLQHLNASVACHRSNAY